MLPLYAWSIHQKRVFLRADLNIPFHDGVIQSDFRLKRILPTIDLLLEKGATILLATHLGRPKEYDPRYSTKPIAEWLQKREYNAQFIPFEPTGYLVPTIRHEGGVIYVLDNLRFFPGETACDPLFANLLHSYADYYVMDAFGVIHKEAASTTLLSGLYPTTHRSVGPLIASEFNGLTPLRNIEKPLLTLLGGSKARTKLPLLNALIHHRRHLSVFVGPALVFTLLKSQHQAVGASLVDDSMITIAQDIMQAFQNGIFQLYLPQDYISANKTLTGALSEHSANKFTSDLLGITIGPQTLSTLEPIIKTAPLIFCNAAMGLPERPQTMEPLKELIAMITSSNGYTVAAGGTTLQTAQEMESLDDWSFCSTGGSAALAVLANEPLPGLLHFPQFETQPAEANQSSTVK